MIESLIKAIIVFSKERTIYTGQGLKRRELRELERAGYVSKKLSSGLGRRFIWFPTQRFIDLLCELKQEKGNENDWSETGNLQD